MERIRAANVWAEKAYLPESRKAHKGESSYSVACSLGMPFLVDGFASDTHWWTGHTDAQNSGYVYIALDGDRWLIERREVKA